MDLAADEARRLPAAVAGATTPWPEAWEGDGCRRVVAHATASYLIASLGCRRPAGGRNRRPFVTTATSSGATTSPWTLHWHRGTRKQRNRPLALPQAGNN